ncbi:MAG: FMN-binding negative transcriptional regulator [Sulfitobacter sp.]
MHPNPIFHTQDDVTNLAFARNRSFGVLATNGTDGPLLAHVPFLLDDEAQHVWLHLVRSNPIARSLKAPMPAKIAISGADSYISPDWYGVDDQVPTWNYVAVHLSGLLELRPQDELRGLLDRQSKLFENRLLPKPAWTTGKMTPSVLDKMMRAIVPCRMQITGIDGTWKLSQNKPDPVRLSAAEHVSKNGLGNDIEILSALMRGADGSARKL